MNVQMWLKGNATIGLDGPSTIAGRIYERVRDMILRAEIAPGEKLLPRQLSEMFGVSSTPIREALRLLEQENLVEIIPHKGAIVRPILSAKQVNDLYLVRLALEQLAVRLASAALPDNQWEDMQQAVDNYAKALKADDFEGALTWDMRFHSLIIQASGNETLQEIFARLENQTQILRRMDRGKTRRQQSRKEHQMILEALKRRDCDGAMAVLEGHIMSGKNHVLDILSKLDQS